MKEFVFSSLWNVSNKMFASFLSFIPQCLSFETFCLECAWQNSLERSYLKIYGMQWTWNILVTKFTNAIYLSAICADWSCVPSDSEYRRTRFRIFNAKGIKERQTYMTCVIPLHFIHKYLMYIDENGSHCEKKLLLLWCRIWYFF